MKIFGNDFEPHKVQGAFREVKAKEHSELLTTDTGSHHTTPEPGPVLAQDS